MQDANDQYVNYEKLMAHINGNERFNAHMRFGTLGDYFTELAKLNVNNRNVKVLEGDFFTYADRQDHYWSGYYTSRPFNKRLERLVEAYLRTSEILFSVVNLKKSSSSSMSKQINDWYKWLMGKFFPFKKNVIFPFQSSHFSTFKTILYYFLSL